jgi:hypothetical protein
MVDSVDDSASSTIEPAFVSPQQAARYCGLSQWWVRNEIAEGRLEGRKIGRRLVVDFQSLKARVAEFPKAKLVRGVIKKGGA